MKRILFCIMFLFLMLVLILSLVDARSKRPLDGNGRTYELDDFGIDYKIVYDTTTWTTIYSRRGILYGIYCVADATWTVSTNYIRQAISTNTVTLPDVKVISPVNVVADASRKSGMTGAISFIPAKALYTVSGLRVRPGASVPLDDAGVENETTLYILYWSR